MDLGEEGLCGGLVRGLEGLEVRVVWGGLEGCEDLLGWRHGFVDGCLLLLCGCWVLGVGCWAWRR